MGLNQKSRVVPPIASDKTLANFSQIIQSNVAALFQVAHVHKVVTAAPSANDGNVGDIYLGDLTTGRQIYVKFSTGWYAVSLTAI